MKNEVTKTDITSEAKNILSTAMKGFCKTAAVKSEMQLWIEDRTMQIRIQEGLEPIEAKQKATTEWQQK